MQLDDVNEAILHHVEEHCGSRRSGRRRRPRAGTQAVGLVESFHLADSASMELKRLKEQCADHHARVAKYLRARA
jgi:hypothetical protein